MKITSEMLKKIGAQGRCEWCTIADDEPYWEIIVFNEKHRICNSCYTRLKPVMEASEE